MKLNLRVDWIKKLKASHLENEFKWCNNDQWREIDIEAIDEADLMLLLNLMDKHASVKGSVAVKQKISSYFKLKHDPGGTKVSRLEQVVTAVKNLLGPTPHKWLFTENDDGHLVPWYVYNVQYHPFNERSESPAHTEISMAAIKRGRKVSRTISLHVKDIGMSCYELLKRRGYFIETPEIIKEYEAESKRYQEVCGLTGEQFLASGRGFVHEDYWNQNWVEMERDGDTTRVVMDDVDSEGDKDDRERREAVTSWFWDEDKKKRDDDGGEAKEKSVVDLPLQPYVKVFDLKNHTFTIIHVGNLKEYEYDTTLVEKLVLPKEKKDLISILVAGADKNLEDIVKGKTGGIIVVCIGPPGTGKTLTAEVFSEQVKRPLYTVQCSQLGTDESSLEKELRIVLARSQRWKAILLIDEADVYVHERGDDIQQNAIVGVFLRVLEYYRGVLFMTSNRETIIDDAIMSRATARIHYEVPTEAQALEIWRVLSKQYRADLTDAGLVELSKEPKFSGISGRSIKNLLKLARLMSLRDPNDVEEITPEMLRYVSQFLPLELKGDPKEKTRLPKRPRKVFRGGLRLGES